MLYLDCQMFEFKHLPVPGGLWDQDPEWLEVVRTINSAIAKEEDRKAKAEENKSKTMGKRS